MNTMKIAPLGHPIATSVELSKSPAICAIPPTLFSPYYLSILS